MKTIIFFLLLICSAILSQTLELKNVQHQYDYVIITIDDFSQSCEMFKTHKENYNNFSVLITTHDQIISEFNSKSTTQDNIREFIRYAGTNWSVPKPNYFLFAADLDSIPNFSFRSVDFPGYDDTSYSDYYYGVDTSEDDSTQISYAIGRIAARNVQELENYFNKVIQYESDTEIQPWHNNALFVTDDLFGGDSISNGDIFINFAHKIANLLPDFMYSDFIIPVDTSKYYGNKETILEKINTGNSSVFFIGHANNNVFTHDSLFTIEDVAKLENSEKPFFLSMYGKQNFSHDGKSSIVNEMILSNNGAISAVTFVGVHFSVSGTTLYENIWNSLYAKISIGNIFLDVVNTSSNFTEKRKFNIFGDPSIVLKSDTPTSVQEIHNTINEKYNLTQNYPNPFNPATTIRYSIPNIANDINQWITLIVYDILGSKIATLVDKTQTPGNYEITFDASNLPSGIYIYSLSANNFMQTKKMILLK
jgi:Peptidase family C25/Secretion system C-terminal sorting domain